MQPVSSSFADNLTTIFLGKRRGGHVALFLSVAKIRSLPKRAFRSSPRDGLTKWIRQCPAVHSDIRQSLPSSVSFFFLILSSMSDKAETWTFDLAPNVQPTNSKLQRIFDCSLLDCKFSDFLIPIYVTHLCGIEYRNSELQNPYQSKK